MTAEATLVAPRDVVLRRGRPEDTEACFQLSMSAVMDLTRRQGTPWEPNLDELWPRMEPLYRRLEDHAAEWWIATNGDGGPPIGYARSVERGGLFELSEFFVSTDSQSAGVGTKLLERAFPVGRGDVRAIIATTDVRALSRYLRADTVARFPIISLEGPPAAADMPPDVEPIRAGAAEIETILEIERAALEFDRGADEVAWLLEQREGYVYRRGGSPIGFGFVGAMGGSGPVGAVEPEDQVPILLHLEARASALGRDKLGFEVPGPNAVALRHLLGRRFQIDPFLTLLLANREFGRFDRFIGFAPPFVL